MTKPTLLLGHSPDPDDAFMFYGLAKGLINSDSLKWSFEHVLQDIQTLNERALRGELHITAISIHAYPYVQDQYALLNCGASMGDRYGPIVVSKAPMQQAQLRGKRILVPGEMTTAFLVLNLLVGKGQFDHEVAMFDEIPLRIASGDADAGLIIHEGQLTYGQLGLHKVVDLGEWWHTQTELPLPLGGNVIRRDLGSDHMKEIAGILHSSICYSLEHREPAVAYAMQYARDMTPELADEFVNMYVNRWTLDYGDQGREAIRVLLKRGSETGLVPDCGSIDFIMP